MPSYIKKCPECGSINLVYKDERGEVICKDCGLVIEEKMIDFTHEWREFDSDSAGKKGRTGAPLTFTKFDQGLGTSIGTGSDIYKLSGKSKNKYMRLQKWHRIELLFS